MKPTAIEPSIRFNLSRGLCSLADQAAEKIAARLPGTNTACKAAADIVKQAIRDNPTIPDQDLTAVDIARRAGMLKTPKRKRRA